MGLKRYVPPALALFVLSPAVGELLSGSSPPLELLNPVAVAFLLGLYGSGAVIVRELAFRWRKSWPSILALGAAYGIVEEGLMCKSFFNPGWMDIGLLGSYGRWAGVSWVWSLELTIFHAVFSITIPILLVSLMYPEKRGEPWARPRTLLLLSAIMAAVVVIGYFGLMPYAVPPALVALAMVAVAILAALASALPQPLFRAKTKNVPKPRWFLALGLFMGTAFFMINWVVPPTGASPIITMLLDVSWVAFFAFTLLRMSGGGSAWSDRHKAALAAGTLGFLMLLGVLEELGGIFGMSAAGIGFALLMAAIYVMVDRRERSGYIPVTAAEAG